MKKIIIVLFAAASLAACNNGSNFESTAIPTLESEIDSVSYLIGFNIGADMKSGEFTDVQMEQFLAGVNRSLAGEEKAIEDEIANATLERYFNNLRVSKNEEKLEKGLAWIEEIKTKEGVKMLTEGVYYEVVAEGEGANPVSGDSVLANYTGMFSDGEVFQTTQERGPVIFTVDGVIPGWTAALKQMNKGAKWVVYLAPEMAYGEFPPRGSGIEPNAALSFEMELVDFWSPKS
jgi:FKBP-type peptidyl-prolyl cis-trans isomerase FklB